MNIYNSMIKPYLNRDLKNVDDIEVEFKVIRITNEI